MKTSAYWAKRAEERIDAAQEVAGAYEKRLVELYRRTLHNINRDTEKILRRFMWSFDMTEEEALELLNEPISMEEVRLLQSRLGLVKDPELRKAIQKRLEAKAYAWRISRQEALRTDIRIHIDRLRHVSRDVIEQGLKEVVETTRASLIQDIGAQAAEHGRVISFSKFSGSLFNKISAAKWYGRNYSERVWRNLGRLEKQLEETLVEGVVQGDSTRKIAMDLSERMNVGIYEARRLVRTETTYYTNQVARTEMEEDGIEKYKYLAARDNRTSEICRELDGQIFDVKDAKVGVNYPPMHPNCRSTVRAWFEEEEEELAYLRGDEYNNSEIRLSTPVRYNRNKDGAGIPAAIEHFNRPLSQRQQWILESLPEYGSNTIIRKKEINLRDLSALTAKTGDEFHLFTKGGYRWVFRGNKTGINIIGNDSETLINGGWKLSGHTHPGDTWMCMTPSKEDKDTLKKLGQDRSVILNSLGQFECFWKE